MVLSGSRHPPHLVPHIIGHQQVTLSVDHHAHRAAHGFFLAIEKPAEHINRIPDRLAGAEGHENHFVAAVRPAVPGAVLPDECPLGEGRRQFAVFSEGQAQ
ncbi:hypothetical protein D3C72_1130390 [compost metagenome]